MLLTEYDEMEQMELFREEGRKEGQKEGAIQTLAELVKKGLLSINDAAAQAKMTEDAFIAKMKAV